MPTVYTENLDHIIVQSDTFGTDLRELGYAGEITVLPYCPPRVIDNVDQSEVRSEIIRVGFLGRLEPQKNLPYLLQIRRLMRNEVRLEIFGDGTERPRLERLANDCPHLVQFHGAIARESVQSAIDNCDMFVVPSVSEGQCLAALEIIARGKPLVATPVGVLPEITRSGRFGSLMPLNDEIGAAAVFDKMVDELRSGLWPRQSIIDDYKAVFDDTVVESSYIRLFERLVATC
jgi:glycosyltransferase involved in cell wall biosynthesis